MSVPVRGVVVQKAAHDCHAADVFGDSFYQLNNLMHYRCRGETTTAVLEALVQAVYEGSGNPSVWGGRVTIDRG